MRAVGNIVAILVIGLASCARAAPDHGGGVADDAGATDGDTDGEAGGCATPQAPVNGSVSAPETSVGGTATYACDTGFVLSGSAVATCLADGSWSDPAPTCQPAVACSSPPPAPVNGSVSAPSLASGSVATFSCTAAYRLLKGQYSTCMNGTWIGATPECATRLSCVCGGELNQGEAMYAEVANPSGTPGLAAGTPGTILAGNSDQGVNFHVLVQWTGWSSGHGGNCQAVDCGPCSNSGSSRWYTSCTAFATPRLRCACAGAYTEGDRVVALVDAPSGAAGVTAGQLGTVIAGSSQLLVEWDGYTGGTDGQCAMATCGRCTPSGSARWWVACTDIGRAP